mgnify:CR=1 FL=1
MFESSDILKGYKTFFWKQVLTTPFESSDILKGYKTSLLFVYISLKVWE